MIIFKNGLEKSILATLAYFDILDYPLTLVEIWKWLYNFENWKLEIENLESNGSLVNIQKTLEDSDILKSFVSSYRGFYFLKGRENLVELRQERYNLAENKFKKALKVVRFLKLIPGIKMIAVCNDLAWSNAAKGSDIDLFVVTASHKIWSVRFWAAGFLKIFGLRPSPKRTQDKICLSFFLDEKNLNLEKISLGEPDIYLIYWIMQIAPIYDHGGIYEKFLKMNEWVKKYLPNSFWIEVNDRRKINNHRSRLMSLNTPICANKFLVFESIFRWLQLKIIPVKLKEMANKDSRVIISDSMLKFHGNDRREEYKNKWIKRIAPHLNPLPKGEREG